MGERIILKAVVVDTMLAFAINNEYVIVGVAFIVVIIIVIVAVVLLRRSSKKKGTKAARGVGNNDWQRQPQQSTGSAGSWNLQGPSNDAPPQWAQQQAQGQQQSWGVPQNAPVQQQGANEWSGQIDVPEETSTPWSNGQGNVPQQTAWGEGTQNAPQAGNSWAASANPGTPPAPSSSAWGAPQQANSYANNAAGGFRNLGTVPQAQSWQQQNPFGSSSGDNTMLRPVGTQPKSLNHDHLQFTAFYPKVIPAGEWKSLLVYAYIESALAAIQADAVKFRDELGPVPGEVDTSTSYPLTRGTRVTLVPTCEGVTFNPERTTFTWIEDWHQIKFRFQVDRRLEGASRNGEITIYAGPLMIASLKISLWIVEPHSSLSTKDNNDMTEVSAYIYKQIFTSYSHTDSTIVYACRNIYKALGFDTLIDVDNLRAGQSWNATLMRMIDNCDIFQLFWSSHAAQSRYVRQEWQYALQHNKGEGFIRPVYWEKPLVPPPGELSHLHFGYIELPKIETSSESRGFTVRRGMLRVESGKESGRTYVVNKDSISIGRSRESDIFLEDLAVSRLHASIMNMGGEKYSLKDEGSANGTKVNGQMINKFQPLPLVEGDKIQVGQIVLTFALQ